METRNGSALVAMAALAALSACAGADEARVSGYGEVRLEDTSAVVPNSKEAFFLRDALQSGFNEIMAAQLAREKASTQQVKDLAQTLIDDQGAISQKLVAIAKDTGVDIPDFHEPTLIRVPEGVPADELSGLSGEQFDREFIAMQVTNHQEAIEMFENIAETTPNQRIRAVAEESLPLLQKHLERAQQLNISPFAER